ncbi:trichohyalin isoform X3 [Esox lucius]|uniref:trichohyalin isoform X3 n=1 Tax=Esox lucius TaxID=8010 RepID=UPI0014774FA4|nr:trichohyalin isoform X3 [Esox lucius]
MDMSLLWAGENLYRSHGEGGDDRGGESGGLGVNKTFRHSLSPHRDSSPLSLADLDMWDSRSHFKSQSTAWSAASFTGGFSSKISTSTIGSGIDSVFGRQSDPGLCKRRRQSGLHTPAGDAFWSMSPVSPGPELRAALEESSFRRAELVQRLREAHGRLDSQTDLMKIREPTLQPGRSTAQILELKHKQLADAVSVLEQEKELAELDRFEDTRRRGELQDKVLQLEMDMLKMRSSRERESVMKPTTSRTDNNNPLSRMLPEEDFYREGKQKAERELSRMREALKEAEEKAEGLETERDRTLQQLRSSKEVQRTVLSQTEEVNQKLDNSTLAKKELQDQLSEARIKLDQAALEMDLLTTKVRKLENSVEDLKAKLTGAISDKDHLLQEKIDLDQHTQGLELQLERAQRAREGYTNQVWELSSQLAEARDQAKQQGQEAVRMKEELVAVKEINEKMTSELEMTKNSLESSSARLHELDTERVIHTNQITALETERLQLIGQNEELLRAIGQNGGEKAKVAELRERCGQLSESKDALESENQRLHECCLTLEAELLEKEEELHQKEEEHRQLEAESAQSIEQLRAVASHWSEKWQDVAMALQTTQAELKELRETIPLDTLQEDAARLMIEVQRLQTEGQKDKEEIQTLRQHKANTETEPNRVQKDAGSMLKVELDACKQRLELERCRSQTLHNKLKGGQAVQMFDKGTETHHEQTAQVSVAEVAQVRTELQEVCNMLRLRDTELEEHQRELESARGQVSQQNSELQRLELELTKRERDLREKEYALSRLERQREAERTEAQIKVSTLELKLIKQKEQAGEGSCQDVPHTNSLSTKLEDSRRVSQLQVERGEAVEKPQALHQLRQGREEKAAVGSKKEKMVSMETIVDQDEQRRRVTEQLKSLFKEREQQAQVYDVSTQKAGPANLEGGEGRSLQDRAPKSKVKNSLDTLLSQRRREKELREKEWQRGSGLRPVSEEQEEEEVHPEQPERELEDKKQVTRLEGELHSKTHTISAISLGTSNLKERHENIHKAKLRFQPQIQALCIPASSHTKRTTSDDRLPLQLDRTTERDIPQVSSSPPSHWEDGIFLAKQVQIASPEYEGDEEEGEDGRCG